jgi:hypothetical protein
MAGLGQVIVSKDNELLKLVRKLHERQWRAQRSRQKAAQGSGTFTPPRQSQDAKTRPSQ